MKRRGAAAAVGIAWAWGVLAIGASVAVAGPSKKDLVAAEADRRGRDAASSVPVGTSVGGEKAVKGDVEPSLHREAWHRELRRRIGKPPAEVVNVFNNWTNEFIAVAVNKAPDLPPQERVDGFLRCHFTNHETAMSPALFGVMVKAAIHFKVDRVNVVSGYRAPKYNLILRKKGRRVARNSQHTHGHAVDFRLPGVSTKRLRDFAVRLKLGGVGYYERDGFVHVDTGPVRTWAD